MANDRIKGITIEIGGDTTGLSKALTGVNSQIKTTQSQLRDVERLLKLDPTNTELLRQKQKLLADAVNNTKEKLESLKTAQEQAGEALKNGTISEKQYDALQREIVDTEQKLKNLEEQAKNSSAALIQIGSAGEKLQEIGGKATSAGKALIPVTGVLTAAGGASAKMAMDFEDAMAKVNTIADTTQVPLDELEKKIMELSDQTGVSSSEIAQNVYDAISAGQKTGDAVNFVANSTTLARAGFTSAGSALDILTTIMNAYGLEADEVNRVSDTLITTQNLGKTTVDQLASSMGKVIPTAKANGVALDQVATGYAIMTANGVATAETTTYMNSMLNELGKSGTKVSDIIKKKTGKSFKDLMDSGSSLADVLSIVSEGAADQEVAFGDLWSSAEAGKAALILLGDGSEKFNGTLEQMQDCTGATEEAFGKLETKSYQAQKTINELKNDAISMGQSLLNTLAPILGEISEKLKEFQEWFDSLNEKQRETIVVVGMLVAALGPFLIIVGQITTGIGGLMTGVSGLSGMLGLLGGAGGPIILTTAAIAALGAAFLATRDDTSEYYDQLSELSEAEQENKDKIDELLESYGDVSSARQNAITDASGQAEKERALWAELQKIVDENGNVKSGYEDRAKYITGELSSALGIEMEMTDNQIQGYKDLCAQIDSVIEKKQADALLESGKDAYVEALSKKTEATAAYSEAQQNSVKNAEELKRAEEELAQAQENYTAVNDDFTGSMWDVNVAAMDAYTALSDAQSKVDALKTKQDELNKTLTDAETVWVGYNTTIQNYEGLTSAVVSGDQQKISEAVLMTMNSFQTAETGTRESLQRQTENLAAAYEAMRQRVADGMPGVTQAQVDQMKVLVDRSKQELARMPSAAAGSVSDVANAIREKTPEMESTGTDFSAGVATGIAAGTKQVTDAAGKMAEDGVDAVKTALDSHSPSRVTHDIGLDYDAGFAEGITEGTAQVMESVTQIATAATSALDEQLKQSGSITQTYQTSQAESWGTWAMNLAATITSTLSGISLNTTTQLTGMRSSIANETASVQSDWNLKWTAIENKHKITMENIKRLTTQTLQTVKALTKAETNTIKTDTITTANELVKGVETELKNLEPVVKEGYEPAISYIKGLIPQARGWSHDMMDEFIAGIRDRMDDLEDACRDVADTVSDYMHFTRPEKGPLRYYEEWMPHMMQGLAKGIKDNRNLVAEQIRNLAEDMSALQDRGGGKQPIYLNVRTVSVLDGKQVAESMDEILGGWY